MLSKLAKLSEREKLALLLASIFVFLLLVKTAVVGPAIKMDELYRARIEAIQDELKLARAIRSGEEEYAEQYENVKKLLKPSDPKAGTEMKGEVDSMLAGVGIKNYQKLDALPPKFGDDSFYKEYFVEVTGFKTDIDRVINLLDNIHDMRSNPGMMKVSKLEIIYDKAAEGVRKVQGSVKLSIVADVDPAELLKPEPGDEANE